MTTASTESIKKKKPPTFQHYPANRAQKLKKAWIDKAKLKSKWKAEKRKEGLIERSKLGIAEIADGEENNESEQEDETHETHSDKEQSPEPSATQAQVQTPAPTIIAPSQSKGAKRVSNDLNRKKRKRGQPEEPSEPQSLRDLTREAYSRSSLHTFKSHPLKKGKTAGHQPQAEKGRGQPNMKLRMNAMLAKIKQDLA